MKLAENYRHLLFCSKGKNNIVVVVGRNATVIEIHNAIAKKLIELGLTPADVTNRDIKIRGI